MNNTAELMTRPKLAVYFSGRRDPLRIDDEGKPWEYNILLGKIAEKGIHIPILAEKVCVIIRDLCIWPFNTGQVYDFTFDGVSYRIEPQTGRTFSAIR